jgi:hypothetical protein
MELIEHLFLELVQRELRTGSGLADAARQAKFVMASDMPAFVAILAEVKAASEPEPEPKAKAKKGKTEKVEPEAEIDIDASLEPTAE